MKKKRKSLRKGDLERVDPVIHLKEQVNLLPYTPECQFKRNRIFSGNILNV